MGKIDDDRQNFLPIFLASITQRQRQDYELAQKHFGPLYRIQDTNYFLKKFKEYQANPNSFQIPTPKPLTDPPSIPSSVPASPTIPASVPTVPASVSTSVIVTGTISTEANK